MDKASDHPDMNDDSAQGRACAAAYKAKGFACEAMKQGQIAIDETVNAAFECTDAAVRKRPLQAAGIAAGIGLLVGVLIRAAA
jgi:ElaB/YqjD/DUF883 family membrane-anchored ribosome-binding protein